MNEKIRINKYLAEKGISTRKGADLLIKNKKVFINGRLAVLGDQVLPTDKIELRNSQTKKYVYYAYNKPRGIVTNSAQKDEKDILSQIKIKNVFPIGRLDKDSEGLIILTNDGRITDRLLNPKYENEKEYIVKTRVTIKDFQLRAMTKGMELEGIDTKPAKTKKLQEKLFSIILKEGQKHEIRRMCDALTLPIDSLKRVRIMNILLGKAGSGDLRKIEGEELKSFLTKLGL